MGFFVIILILIHLFSLIGAHQDQRSTDIVIMTAICILVVVVMIAGVLCWRRRTGEHRNCTRVKLQGHENKRMNNSKCAETHGRLCVVFQEAV